MGVGGGEGRNQGWLFTYDRSGCCNPCKFSPLLVECEEQTGCHCDKSAVQSSLRLAGALSLTFRSRS